MKYILLLFVSYIICLSSFAQAGNTDSIPNPARDFKHHNAETVLEEKYDSTQFKRAIREPKPSPFAFRVGLGVAGHIYNQSTKSWLDGNHTSIFLGLDLNYKRFTLGFKGKVWTRYPQDNLVFGQDTLFGNFKLNPAKGDYYIGYEIVKLKSFSIEPCIGYTFHEFRVINQREFQKEFNIPKVSGPIVGASFIKFFKGKWGDITAVSLQLNYAFVDFSKVHPKLGFGYYDINLSVAYDFGSAFRYEKYDINYASH